MISTTPINDQRSTIDTMASYPSTRFDLKVEKDFAIQLTDSQLRLQQRIHGSVEHAGSRMDLPEFSPHEEDENNALMLRKALNKSNTRHSTGAVVNTADRKAMLRKILAQKSRSRAAAIERAVEHNEQNLASSRHSAPVDQYEAYPIKSEHAAMRQHDPNQAPIRHPTVQKQGMRYPRKAAPQIITSSAPHQDPPKSDASGSASNSKEEQKALLRKVLANSRARRLNAAEQRISPRSSLIESQKKAMSAASVRRESVPVITRLDVSRPQGTLSPRSSLMQSQRKSMIEIKSKKRNEAPQEQPTDDRLQRTHEPPRPLQQNHMHRENAALERTRTKPAEHEFKSPIRNRENYQVNKSTVQSQSQAAKSHASDDAQFTDPSRSQHSSASLKSREILTSSRFASADTPAKLKVVTHNEVARSDVPARISDSNRISPTKLRLPPPEQELDSYGAFFSVLQKEGGNDHRELFRSFRSIFYSRKIELTEKQKRIKFDGKTKRTLTEMNLYLKRTSDMECKAETQLVNDKKFAKEGFQRPLSPRRLDLDIQQSHSHESGSDASGTLRVQLPPDLKKVKSWMTSFRSTQEKAAPVGTEIVRAPIDSVARSPPPEPVNRQTSWLAAHREKQLLATTSLQSKTEEGLASPSSCRKRRINEADSPPPPWAKIQLKSTRDISVNARDEPGESSIVPWSKKQLRGTGALTGIHESADENDIHVEESTSVAHSLDSSVRTDQGHQGSEPSGGEKKEPHATFQYHPKTKKETVIKSFVPTTSESVATVPWSSRLKLVHVEDTQPEPQSSVPWSNVQLRKRVGVAPDIAGDSKADKVPAVQMLRKTNQSVSEEPYDVSQEAKTTEDAMVEAPSADTPSKLKIHGAVQMLRKTDFAADEEPYDVSLDAKTYKGAVVEDVYDDPSSATSSKVTIHGALAEMFAARLGQAPKPSTAEESPTADSSVSENTGEEVPTLKVKNALSAMLASRSGPISKPPAQVNKDSVSERSSPTKAKSALAAMLAQRLDPVSNIAETPSQRSGTEDNPSAPDIKSALANMFAARSARNDTAETKPRISVGDFIDLSSLSAELRKMLHGFISVELSTLPSLPNEVVVLGRELILVATLESTDSRQRVVWHHLRENIESITLDMAQNVADLIMSDGAHKSLSFRSAEGCLRFAACFYQAADVVSTEPKSETRQTDVRTVPSELAGSTEQLNSEEQQFLERFRAARKVRDANDLLKAMIGGDDSDGDMSDEDQKTIDRYKTMLRMQIPPEAVSHKMMRDGVPKRLADMVLRQDTPSLKGESNSCLSEEDEHIADRYRKMLKMQIPKEAVQHKMIKEGVDQKIVDAVLNNDTLVVEPQSAVAENEPKSIFSEDEEKIIASYRKMIKMCIPPDAIRHKMKKDQVNDKIVFAIFPEDATAATAKPGKGTVLTDDEQTIADTYQKMLKMRIPPEAVRHKMAKDAVSDKIISAVLGEESNEKKASTGLSEEDQKAVVGYKKMLKMHFPEEAVRHKMAKEGANEKIVGAVFPAKKDSTAPAPIASKASLRGSNLVALHWTPLSGEELNNSVWRASKKRKVGGTQPETNDISKLIELFKKKSNPKGGAAVGPVSTSDGNGKAKLIDLNRANNIAICLKAFKDFTHQQLADTIAHLDPQELISGERVQFVKDLLPNLQEVQAIKAYTGDDARLVPAELFFRRIVAVKRIEVKVEVMKMMVTFRANAFGFLENYRILERACVQAQSSDKLQEVLEMVLHVGNIMNEGTRTGGAAGFKFDSLLKLTQTKSADGKTTVLDYLVMIFVAKNKRETLDIKSEFIDCQTASRMLISDMNTEVKAMSDALQKCKTELNNMKKEVGVISDERSAEPKSTPCDDPMSALLSAIKTRGSQGDDDPTASTPSKAKAASSYLEAINSRKNAENKREDDIQKPGKLNLVSIKDKCQLNGEKEEASLLRKVISSCTSPDLGDDEGLPIEQMESDISVTPPKPTRPATIQGGMNRLEDFIAEAQETMSELQTTKNAAINACKNLAKYCGESGGEQSATTLLGILCQFATNLSDAVKKYDRRLELEAKKAAQKQKEEQQSRRKVFVESKGFGQIVASKDSLVPGAVANVEGGVHESFVDQTTHDRSAEEYSSEASEGTTIDVSQIQGNAKAKCVPKSKDGPSLVSMVNKMLKEASPRARQDFQAGVVYDDVDDETLKAIYEKERESLLRSPPRRRRISGNLDLMSAIKQRREDAEKE